MREALQLSYRGSVRARLVQFDQASGTETDLVRFDHGSSSAFTTVGSETAPTSTVMASSPVLLREGNPADLAAVKTFAMSDF